MKKMMLILVVALLGIITISGNTNVLGAPTDTIFFQEAENDPDKGEKKFKVFAGTECKNSLATNSTIHHSKSHPPFLFPSPVMASHEPPPDALN